MSKSVSLLRRFVDAIGPKLNRTHSLEQQISLARHSVNTLNEKLTNQEIQFSSNIKIMSETIQRLEKEKKALEDRVHELVDKLEARKPVGEVKVLKEHVIRSKEELAAIAAMEKLAVSEEKVASATADKSGAAAKSANKKSELKTKQKNAAKEPEKPVDIGRLDLRIGRILEVNRHPDADSLYVEKIDCGDPEGPRTVVSGLVKHVPIEEMKDRMVVVLCNLKPAKMRGILSEAMVMCASTPDKVELLQPPTGVKPGDRVTCSQFPGEPDSQLNPKKKVWEQVSPDLKTNGDGIATYKGIELSVAGSNDKFRANIMDAPIR